jgi:hypothetical protein
VHDCVVEVEKLDTKPCPDKVVLAALIVSPRTLWTVTGGAVVVVVLTVVVGHGPVDTTRLTGEFGCTCVPAAGLCADTSPLPAVEEQTEV